MKVTASILEVVEGLKGEALAKAKRTGLYDRFIKDPPPPPPEPVKKGGAFDDLEDDIPWS